MYDGQDLKTGVIQTDFGWPRPIRPPANPPQQIPSEVKLRISSGLEARHILCRGVSHRNKENTAPEARRTSIELVMD